jgi:hypothetical protein
VEGVLADGRRPRADRALERLDNIFLPPEAKGLLHRRRRAVHVQPADSDDVLVNQIEELDGPRLRYLTIS